MALIRRPQVVVLRALGLGDFLTGIPALRALRRAFPDEEIVLAGPRTLHPLVELAGVADRVLGVNGLQPLAWAEEPPHIAVNLHGRGPQSHELLRQLHPQRLVAFGCDEASHSGPPWVSEEHEVRRWCRLVEEDLHIAADPDDLGLPRPTEPPIVAGAVVVHPGAAFGSRRWPAERFAQVARWLVAAGYEVVVTGGRDEVGLADQVRRAADLPDEAVLAGRTDLIQLAAQIAAARLLVCGDTGVAHLATAFSTPSVVLFGPTAPSRWGPPVTSRHAVIWHGDGTGDPCGDKVDPALSRVDVNEVLIQVERLLPEPLSRSAAGRRTTPASA